MAYTAINFVQAYLGNNITQNTHGFTLGQVVTLNGGTWVLAEPDTQVDSQVVGMVTGPITTNTFVLSQVGWIFGFTLNTFIAGSLYYLSPTSPGGLSLTPGNIKIPLFYADTTQSGYFLASYPNPPVPSGIPWVPTLSSGTLVTNTGANANSSGALVLALPRPTGGFQLNDTFGIYNVLGNSVSITFSSPYTVEYGATIASASVVNATAGACIILTCVNAEFTLNCTSNPVGTWTFT